MDRNVVVLVLVVLAILAFLMVKDGSLESLFAGQQATATPAPVVTVVVIYPCTGTESGANCWRAPEDAPGIQSWQQSGSFPDDNP